MSSWTALLSSVMGGSLTLAAVALVQWSTRRRDYDARLWSRRADAYVALLQWRLSPPDEDKIPSPYHLAEAREAWRERAFPLLAEVSLFGGTRITEIIANNSYLFQAVDVFAEMSPGQLADFARTELASSDGGSRRGVGLGSGRRP